MNMIKTNNSLVVFLIIILSVLIFSCTSPSHINNKIESETLINNVKSIKEKYPNLDSLKIEYLNELVAINKGRKAFVSYGSKYFKDEEYVEKIVVDKAKFNEQKEKIFNYFNAKNITYYKLLNQISKLDSIEKNYKNRIQKISKSMQEIYKDIDKRCLEIQKEIDKSESNTKKRENKLNKMVDLKIIGIAEKEYDHSDVVEVKIKMTNKTSKPIEAISFDLELTDKLGNKIVTIGCRSNNKFINSYIGYWTYDRWDNSEIFNKLKNTKLSHISYVKQQINKINHGGELISANDYEYESDIMDEKHPINFEYKTPEILFGYCPYSDNDELLSLLNKTLENWEKKKKILESEKKKEIEVHAPVAEKYYEMATKFVNISLAIE